MKQILGIDLGGTSIKYSLMDKEGTVFDVHHVPTPKDSFETLVQTLDQIVLPFKQQISGIAISFPGRVNPLTGFIYTGGAIASYMSNIPFKQLLEERYQLPVAIENDGKCAAHAELWKGNLQNVNSGAVVLIGFGIGGGIVLDGKVWRGAHSSSSEFSNLITDYYFDQKPGYWMDHCGIYGLLRPYAQRKGLDITKVNGKLFFEALNQQDQDAQSIYQHYLKSLRSGILTLQAILDVEKYCIGGGISAQDRLIEDIRQEINDYFDHIPNYVAQIRPEIDRCQFSNNANLIGALKNFIDIYG